MYGGGIFDEFADRPHENAPTRGCAHFDGDSGRNEYVVRALFDGAVQKAYEYDPDGVFAVLEKDL